MRHASIDPSHDPNPLAARERELVTLDATGVRRFARGRLVEGVDWARLAAVALHTTSDGPFADDLFWVLVADDGTGCVVPSELASSVDLLGALGRLPRFDYEAVIAASGCVEERTFAVWSGTGEEAARAMAGHAPEATPAAAP